MALSEEKMRSYGKRLLLSRMRILINNGFYGLLLMHMRFAIDESCETAATDGEKIYFGPEFLDNLSDSEVDFVMMHEILHAALCHCSRKGERNLLAFNIACDIVVNSNILLSNNMNSESITLKEYGESMHLTPSGDEGHKYTAEQVYEMLPLSRGGKTSFGNGRGKKGSRAKGNAKGQGDGWDDHTRWKEEDDGDGSMSDVWNKRIIDAAEAIEIQDASRSCGAVPLFAQRLLKELRSPQTDWRTILADFIQEEVCDYSFSPPDRRFGDSPFFLPDFNDTDITVSDILFMIDTSGSMSDDMVTAAYSEVKGAIDQFNGKLQGKLGFFDAAVTEPQPFCSEEEFKAIKPKGGGGTSFSAVFEYISEHMTDEPPACIIILTDGYDTFPGQASANGVPVLWLINNEDITPPWGKVARIKV